MNNDGEQLMNRKQRIDNKYYDKECNNCIANGIIDRM
jgi:hypothetical protein